MHDQIFLGGTCGNNTWRDAFTAAMVERGASPDLMFNPVVADWNAEAQRRDEEAKATARYLLYYIASPMQEGIPVSSYSMVEATMGLYDNPGTTVVVFDTAGITGHPLKAIDQCRRVLQARFPDGNIFASAAEAVDWLSMALCLGEGGK